MEFARLEEPHEDTQSRKKHFREFILRLPDDQARVELAVVLFPLLRRFVRLLEPLVLEETGDLAHSVFRHAAAFLCPASSASARRYSLGNTLTKRPRYSLHLSRMVEARFELV